MSYSATDTFASLIDETITSLQGYGTTGDQVATLTSDLSDSAVTFTVDDGEPFSRGIVEIDEEIMYVNYAENGTVYVPAWGRGYKGTTKAAHAAGSPVWVAPTWPRSIVAREVNNTIRSLYPSLFAVNTLDFLSESATFQYPMPADVENVLAVEWRWNYPDAWQTVKAWEEVHSGYVPDYPSGKSLAIGDPLPPATKIHVTYAALPTLLTSPTSPFTDTGLSASARDVVVLGTASRLVPWMDTSRLPVTTVPSDAVDAGQRVGIATQVAGSLRAQYQARLDQERRILLSRYPTRSHRVR